MASWSAWLVCAAAFVASCRGDRGADVESRSAALRRHIPRSGGVVTAVPPKPLSTAPLGVIVHLKGQPALEKHAGARSRGLAAARAAAKAQRTTLQAQHGRILDALGKKLGPFSARRGRGIVVGRSAEEFTEIFNGLALHGIDEASARGLLANDPDVLKIEPIVEVRATLLQSVPLIEADKVWAMADGNGLPIDGAGMRIGIIDTGLDYTHPDLGGCFGAGCKVAAGWDFVNDDPDPMDDHGHGTHVAATAAGDGTYAGPGGPAPIRGVAPGATIYAYKVLNSGGSGGSDDIIAAIERCADPNGDGDPSDHLDVCSMSIGGGGDPDDAMSLAVDAAVANGVVFSIAAGNSGPTAQTINSPGTSRRAITVAAACKTSEIGTSATCGTPIAAFSSRGPVVWSGGTLAKPDVAAPGVDICAAEWGSYQSGSRCLDGRHIAISGTSMATPHVAGVAVLLRQAHPEWTPDQVKSYIVTSAHSLGLDSTVQGAGMIDAKDAITLGGLPSQIGRIGGTPLRDVDVPAGRFGNFSSNLTITNTTPGSLTFTGSVTTDAGLTVTLTPTTFTVGAGATATVTVARQVDHDVVASGAEARGTITFASGQGNLQVGVQVGVRDRLVASSGTVDLGVDLASQTTWTGQATVQLTNVRADASQTYTTSIDCCAAIGQSPTSSISASVDQPTVTLGPGGTASVGVTVTATNAALASGRWTGALHLTSPLGALTIPVTFFKGYGIRINSSTTPQTISIASAKTGSTETAPTGTSTTFYTTTPGPYYVEAIWYVSVYYHVIAIVDTNAPIATVTMDQSQAVYTYDVYPRDDNGQPFANSASLVYRFTQSSSGGGSRRQVLAGGPYHMQIHASAIPAGVNFRAAAVGISPDPFGYVYELDGPISSNQVLTNAGSDVIVKEVRTFSPGVKSTAVFVPVACVHLQPWISDPPGPITGANVDCVMNSQMTLPSGTARMLFYNSSNRDLLAAPYPDAPSISYALYDGTIYGGAWLGEGPQMWPSKAHPLTFLPPAPWSYMVRANEMYPYFRIDDPPGDVIPVAPGPLQDEWAWDNHKTDWSALRGRSRGQDPFIWGGGYTDYDFTTSPVTYHLYRDGALVSGGTMPANYPIYPTLADGDYQYDMTRAPTIGGVTATTESMSRFTVSGAMSIDENPPALRGLHLVGRGLWQQVLDPTIVNRLRFTLDPVPGNGNNNPSGPPPFYAPLADGLAQVTVQQSTDGVTWRTVTATALGNGGYLTDTLDLDPTATATTLRIVATDLGGNLLRETFTIPHGASYGAGADVTAPTTAITSPADGATLAADASVTAVASDDVGVSRVDLLLDGATVASATTAPYVFTFDPSIVGPGSHVLRTRAQDAAENIGLSAPVTVTLQNGDTTPPTVAFTSPAAGAVVSGRPSLVATASDDHRVARVDFYEGATALASLQTAPYTTTWDTTTGADGARTVTAIATDATGNTATTTRTVTVDNTPPTVAWTYPTNGANVSGTITFSVNAQDAIGVARVEYWINDYSILATSTTPPFSAPYFIGVYSGHINLRARVYDTAGNMGQSELISVNVLADTTPPAVAITSPADGTIVGANSSVTIDASDPSGINWIELDDGTTQLFQGLVAGPPYHLDFHAGGLPDGVHTLTAKAMDGDFNLGTSAPVHVTLDQVPPTVSVTAPPTGTRVSGTVAVTATAADAVALASVSLDVDGLGAMQTLTTGPFVFVWNTLTWADGQHSVNVRATDVAGNQSVAATFVTVDNAVTATLTAPASGALVGASTPVSATTTNDAAVASLAFLDGATTIATRTSAPWTATWSPTASGAHTLKAQVTDRQGRVTTSAGVTVTVDVTAPAVTLTAPANNATVSGLVAVTATASDNVAVARVELYDGATILSTVTTPPYATTWNTANAALGAHALKARAYDTAGNLADSAAVAVTVVTAPPSDTTPPAVSLTAPAAGAVVTGTVTWSATASDNVGVTKVELRDGSTVVTTLTASPYTFNWDTSSVATGAHTLTAKAYDAAGNSTTSASRSITIDRTAPTVSLTAPAAGATVSATVTVSATATDNASVARVEFYRDGSTLLATDATSPYSISWDTTTTAAGSHSLTAKAYDAAGNVTTSAARSVTVKDVTAPAVTFTSPANGAQVTVGSTITMAATATDATGVSKVEFSVGATLTCTEHLLPYTCNWKVPTGTGKNYTLTAKAYDAANNTRTATVTVTSK